MRIVLSVGLLCLTFLLCYWMDNRRTHRKKQLQTVRREAMTATAGLKAVQKEIGTQVAATYPDLGVLAVLVQDYLDEIENVEGERR